VRLGGETAGSVAARRWRRTRLPLLVAGVVVLAALVVALIRPATNGEPLAVDNPGQGGVRALAHVLGDHGVRVRETRSSAEAVAAAEAGTTLAVVNAGTLTDDELTDLAATDADLVLVDAPDGWLDVLTNGLVRESYDSAYGEPRDAACDDPDARAAGTLSSADYTLELTGPGTLCFPPDNPVDGVSTGAYAVVTAHGRAVRVVADSVVLTNGTITQEGNAALALRALGHHERLTWFRPQSGSMADLATGPGLGDMLPPGSAEVAAAVGLVLLVVALWRGRGLGRVVTEPLPVRVRAAEATRGRGRLYRRARSRGHAAAALRAATARRCALRLGLPRSADAPTVIEALATAARRPTHEVAALLYGPPPSDDAELLALSRALDQLESEVHRP
jgi:hypothetical protein